MWRLHSLPLLRPGERGLLLKWSEQDRGWSRADLLSPPRGRDTWWGESPRPHGCAVRWGMAWPLVSPLPCAVSLTLSTPPPFLAYPVCCPSLSCLPLSLQPVSTECQVSAGRQGNILPPDIVPSPPQLNVIATATPVTARRLCRWRASSGVVRGLQSARLGPCSPDSLMPCAPGRIPPLEGLDTRVRRCQIDPLLSF